MNIEQALRESLEVLDLSLWSKSGAHVFNSETAITDLAHSIEVRLRATPSPEPQELDEERLALAIARCRGWYHPPGSPGEYAVNAALEIAAAYRSADRTPEPE